MLIKSVELTNYRCFETYAVRFDDGIHAFIGRNGKGKTSVLESIVWSLYGAKKDGVLRTDAKGIVRRGASFAKAIVRFSSGDKMYRVERSVNNRGNSNAILYDEVDNRSIAKGSSAVEDKISEIVGMNYEGFVSSAYSRQGDLGNFAGMKPAERRKIIARMLRLDDAQRRSDSASESRKTLKKMLEEGTIGWYGKNFESKIKEIDERMTVLVTDMEKKSELEAAGKQVVEQLGSEVDVTLKDITMLRNLSGEKMSRKSQLDVAERMLRDRRSSHDTDVSTYDAFMTEYHDVEKTDVDEVKLMLIELGNRKDALIGEKGAVKSRSSSAENRLNHMKQMNVGLCSHCYQMVTGEHLEGVRKEIQDELDKALGEHGRIEHDMIEVSKEIDRTELKKDLYLRWERLRDACKVAVDGLSRTQLDYDKCVSDYDAVTFDAGTLKSKEDDYACLSKRLEATKDTLRDVSIGKNRIVDEMERLKGERVVWENGRKDYERVMNEVADYSLYIQAVDDFRRWIIEHIIPEVFEKASLVLKVISDGKMNSVSLGDDYGISVFSERNQVSMDEFSGGEKDLVNISLRIALCMLFRQSDLLMMDEVFAQLDDDVVESVIQGFGYLPFRQILMVTHKDSIKGRLGRTVDFDVIE